MSTGPDVWRARALDLTVGRFATPENLGPAINGGFETNVYVTPDESLLLVSRDDAPDGFGGDDIYASRSVGGLLGKYGGKWMISDVLWQGPLNR